MAQSIVLLVSSMESGGAERAAASLANAWAARGDSVQLVVTFSGRGKCFYALEPRVELVFLADQVARSDRTLIGKAARLLALRRLLARRRPNVVVSFLTNVNIAAIIASAGLGVPVIVSERSYPPADIRRRGQPSLRRLTYPFANCVVMLTHEGLSWLNTAIPRAKGCVIPNAISYPLLPSEPVVPPSDHIAEDRRLLLAVGRLDEGKQFGILVRAFAALASEHARWDLAIIGDGPLKQELKHEVLRRGLDSRIMLPGRAGNIADWYARADLYVMTSRYEGFPNTLAEAMAYGRAAISYDCNTGPRDIIRAETDGLLVQPVGDEYALLSALNRLMANDDERARMGKRASEVRERYSIQRVVSIWDRLFEEVRGVA